MSRILKLVLTFPFLVGQVNFPSYGQTPSDSTSTTPVNAAQDSAHPIVIPFEIEIIARQLNVPEIQFLRPSPVTQQIYKDDALKRLNAHYLSFNVPALATYLVDNLPGDQFARPYILDHKMIGRLNVSYGGNSIFNPSIVDITGQQSFYSPSTNELGGVLYVLPKHIPGGNGFGLSGSSDLIERHGSLTYQFGNSSATLGKISMGVRETKPTWPLNEISALNAIPPSLDVQTYASIYFANKSSVEIFSRIARERNDWTDAKALPVATQNPFPNSTAISMNPDYSSRVHENSSQEFIVTRYQLPVSPQTDATVSVSYEKNDISSFRKTSDFENEVHNRSRMVQGNLKLRNEKNGDQTAWVSAHIAKSDEDGDGDATYSFQRGGLEQTFPVFYEIRVKPSVGFLTYDNKTAVLLNLACQIPWENAVVTMGYGNYADFFVYNDGLFHAVRERPNEVQRGRQAGITIDAKNVNIDNVPIVLDRLQVSVMWKHLDAEFRTRRGNIRVGNFGISAEKKINDQLGCEMTYAYTPAEQDGEPLLGASDHRLRAGVVYSPAPDWKFAMEVTHKSGIQVEDNQGNYAVRGRTFRVAPSTYTNISGTKTLDLFGVPLDVTLSLYNFTRWVSIPQLPIGGKSQFAPFWGNIRVEFR